MYVVDVLPHQLQPLLINPLSISGVFPVLIDEPCMMVFFSAPARVWLLVGFLDAGLILLAQTVRYIHLPCSSPYMILWVVFKLRAGRRRKVDLVNFFVRLAIYV